MHFRLGNGCYRFRFMARDQGHDQYGRKEKFFHYSWLFKVLHCSFKVIYPPISSCNSKAAHRFASRKRSSRFTLARNTMPLSISETAATERPSGFLISKPTLPAKVFPLLPFFSSLVTGTMI